MRFLRLLPTQPSRCHVLAVCALVSQVFAAIGAPVPSHHLFRSNSSSSSSSSSSVPYPCRDNPCGCLTSEQCWAGDCCCFTLEQKLAWADARGINPPDHVRSTVESRKTQGKSPKPKRPCCQGAAESTEPETPLSTAPICERDSGLSIPNALSEDGSMIRWVGGVFTTKCRGEGPAGVLKLDPSVPPTLTSERLTTPEPERFVRVPSVPIVILSQSPPIPPPRLV